MVREKGGGGGSGGGWCGVGYRVERRERSFLVMKWYEGSRRYS